MNGLLRIRQRYQGLAQSDKKLADYLLLQPDTGAPFKLSATGQRSRSQSVQRREVRAKTRL
ncbi:RpiR-family transcriptional regulator [Escherichia coli]|uniref:RpiR-family transcriptional regulator n=1 Tax=Escherichia coli TaxID=562 RepID=A0A485JBC6_ECOLX|nr:RpiR-family transcriptional regulator [Escherichia coli]